jgi:hypothetical protein
MLRRISSTVKVAGYIDRLGGVLYESTSFLVVVQYLRTIKNNRLTSLPT